MGRDAASITCARRISWRSRFDDYAMSGPQVAARLRCRSLERGFLSDVGHSRLAVAHHRPLIAVAGDFVGNLSQRDSPLRQQNQSCDEEVPRMQFAHKSAIAWGCRG